ncbi:tetratricopeptide repeat protein [Streptomyces sp. NPDC057743]|uniref:tetratricopeptide repeat protein n=1 Tax=Streptomyces sp. NPDC057743 TaxID=3346236 RepID=UPI0036AD019E
MVEETRNSVGGGAEVQHLVQAGRIGTVHLHSAGAPAPRRTPCQLPPEIGHFEDREEEQSAALEAAEAWLDTQSADRPLILALTGLSGVGKTELAFRLARRLQARCPDGVLYADLDADRRAGAVDLHESLGQLLRTLGVEHDWVERSFAARRGQYWDETRHRRLVVVLDNVRGFEAEAALLLPSSPGSVVILAGQHRLDDLEPGTAVELPLRPLADEHAVRLLLHTVNDPALTARPQTAAALAEGCGGLPAALRVAGRWVRRNRRRGWTRLTTELAAELREKGVPDIEHVWDTAYGDLTPQAGAAYRLFAALPGVALSPEAATALLGTGPDAAADALAELERAGLLDAGPDPDAVDAHPDGDAPAERLRMHDLVRGHARRRAADGTPNEADDGRRRLLRWLLRQAQRADHAAGPRMTLAPPAAALPEAPDLDFPDESTARQWLHAERRVLHAGVHLASAAGLHAESWALCEPLWTHLLDHPGSADHIDSFRVGRDAAQRAEDLRATIRMRCQLARPLWESERYEEAGRELDAAVSGAALLGTDAADRKLYASALEFRGRLQAEQGHWAAAVPDYQRSARIHAELPNPYGVLLLDYQLGQAWEGLGELDRAEAELTRAHEAARELGRERMTARTGLALGRVLARRGRPEPARALYEAALAGARQRGSTTEEVRVLDALADLAAETGDDAAAAAHREAARAVRERAGGRRRD